MANSKIRISLKELKSALHQAFVKATPDLCFVTGIARSGTSAMTHWLGQQKGVVSFSETRILLGLHQFMVTTERHKSLKNSETLLKDLLLDLAIKYYGHQKLLLGKKLLVDKEPFFPLTFTDGVHYFNFLEFLLNTFPDLRIICMIREPLSTIWSMTQRKWGYSINQIMAPQDYSLAYYIAAWCVGIEQLAKFKRNPRVFFCKYEQLQLTPQKLSSKIGEFLKIRSPQPFKFTVNSQESFSETQRVQILRESIPIMQQFYSDEELSVIYSPDLITKSRKS